MYTRPRPVRPVLVPALALLLWAWSAPVRAEDLSVKVENYIFAASEALADGEPSLALSLLRRAKTEAPESCIVDEYLCRTYAAIGNAKMARDSYSRFASCMEVTDEGVLNELDGLIAAVEAAPPQPAPTEPEPAATPPAIAPTAPAPVVLVAPNPTHRYPGRGAGWALFATGMVVGAGGGVGTGLTWNWGEHYVERHNQESYEALIPWNHASVIGIGVGSLLAVAGLGLEIGLARHGQKNLTVAAVGNGLAIEVRR